MIRFHVNTKPVEVDIDPDTPLLWVLREQLQLTGTKYGCGIAVCGSCIVHVDGEPVKSCVASVSEVAGKQVTTIEGLAKDNSLHPVQQAWLDESVPECGYCQPGQIMAATALLNRVSSPSDEEIEQTMSQVLCRCGTYLRIKKAIKRAINNQEEG